MATAQAQDGLARVYAAGSLTSALAQIIKASGIPENRFDKPVFGPAGLLRQRLEKGEPADLYLSADMNHPRTLVAGGRGSLIIPFARNRLCVVAEKSLKLTPDTVLERLLDPDTRVATSTPVADPGGDYTWAMFARADKARPGARATLEGKAIQLIGSPNAMVPIGGRSIATSIFLAGKADALIYYCSGVAETLRELPDLAATILPADLDVPVLYGMTLLSDNADAARLALFIVSEKGQTILQNAGLLTVAPTP